MSKSPVLGFDVPEPGSIFFPEQVKKALLALEASIPQGTKTGAAAIPPSCPQPLPTPEVVVPRKLELDELVVLGDAQFKGELRGTPRFAEEAGRLGGARRFSLASKMLDCEFAVFDGTQDVVLKAEVNINRLLGAMGLRSAATCEREEFEKAGAVAEAVKDRQQHSETLDKLVAFVERSGGFDGENELVALRGLIGREETQDLVEQRLNAAMTQVVKGRKTTVITEDGVFEGDEKAIDSEIELVGMGEDGTKERGGDSGWYGKLCLGRGIGRVKVTVGRETGLAGIVLATPDALIVSDGILVRKERGRGGESNEDFLAYGGAGGSTPLGFGGAGQAARHGTTRNGYDGSGWGSGGGSGVGKGLGGKGAPAVVIVKEWLA